jgi:hypothetical protein
MRHFLKLQSMLLKNILYKQISIWTLVTAGTNTSEAPRDFALYSLEDCAFFIRTCTQGVSMLWTGIELTTPVVIGDNENILATTIPHHDHNGLARLHEHYVELSVCAYIVLAFCIIDFSPKSLPTWIFSFHRLARDNRTINIGQPPIK